MNDLIIRKIEFDDIDQIMEIENECFSMPWSKESFIYEIDYNKVSEYYVAILGTEIVGYIGIWYILDEGNITNVAVRKSYRNQGIADTIINEVIKEAKAKKIEKIFLEVRESNNSAIKLYEKHSFIKIDRRKGYYKDNNEDAIIMLMQVE